MAKNKARKTLGIAEDGGWRAENDLRTMIEAEEIEKDPKRLAAAQSLAKKKLLAMASIAKEDPNDD